MTSRERVRLALDHKEPDRVPVDLGSSLVTGIMVSTYARLRQTLGVNDSPPRVRDIFQMLGDVEHEVLGRLGCDVVGLTTLYGCFGIPSRDWKPWRTFDGTEVLVPGQFNYVVDDRGDLLISPGGDTRKPPSGRMPKGGYYFDMIPRQQPLDWDRLDPDEFAEQFGPLGDEELSYQQAQAEHFHSNTEFGLVSGLFPGSLGDFAQVPGCEMDEPKGVRNLDDWMVAHLTHPEYIKGIFARQTEHALENMELYRQAVGDRILGIFISGTDFGSQRTELISPDVYRELYKPFHARINQWVHAHTNWKTIFHCCGSVHNLLPDFIEAGVDVLNPVQCSAANMEPDRLKREFGDRLVFWGGGVDTQHTLPFGTPEEVREEVAERLRLFAPGGGYVFNPIHNVQAKTPVENLIAMFEAVREYGKYPIT
jgi:hypothetical protein